LFQGKPYVEQFLNPVDRKGYSKYINKGKTSNVIPKQPQFNPYNISQNPILPNPQNGPFIPQYPGFNMQPMMNPPFGQVPMNKPPNLNPNFKNWFIYSSFICIQSIQSDSESIKNILFDKTKLYFINKFDVIKYKFPTKIGPDNIIY